MELGRFDVISESVKNNYSSNTMTPAMASSLLNGERAVASLFVSSILDSTHAYLLYEGLAFSLLAVSAIFVEISVESYDSTSRFNTRNCYTDEWIVWVYNGIADSTIDVHVKSKNDDLGHHNISSGQGYNFGFCENFFENTVFGGDFTHESQFVHFNVYDKEISRLVGRGIEYVNTAFWVLKQDGYYLSQDDKPFDDPTWIFRGHWQ